MKQILSRIMVPEYGALLLRISLGTVLLAHSLYLKLMVFTLSGTAEFFASIGLPALLAYVVFIAEVVAGVGLVLGVRVRELAVVAAIVLLGAAWAHSENGWLFSNQSGGWEYPVFLAFASIAQAMLGSGACALSTRPVITNKTLTGAI